MWAGWRELLMAGSVTLYRERLEREPLLPGLSRPS
jgi:hypothetical protein